MDKKERERNHSDLTDDGSADNRTPPDCDMYYMYTSLYILLAPVTITLATSMLQGTDLVFGAVPVYVAAAMFLYAYFCIGIFKLQKPDSMFKLYLPVLLYLFWQLFLWIFFNLFIHDRKYMFIDFALASFNLYGAWFIDDRWHSMQLLNWVYNLALLGGFAAGERLAFRRTKIARTPFNRKRFRLALLCGGVLLLLSEVVFLCVGGVK